jgi:hypothetical protein
MPCSLSVAVTAVNPLARIAACSPCAKFSSESMRRILLDMDVRNPGFL